LSIDARMEIVKAESQSGKKGKGVSSLQPRIYSHSMVLGGLEEIS